MRGTIKLFYLICGFLAAWPVYAADISTARELLSSIDVSNSDNIAPEILDAYQALEQSVQDAEDLDRQYHDDLQENANAMREKEQSTENKLLGGITIAATGIGGMQVGGGAAAADADAERDMNAWLGTFRCDYGAGLNIAGGETNVSLPGANLLLPLINEYTTLASDLKIRKESLGMAPGIESVEILDAADANLYDNEAIGKTENVFETVAERVASGDAEKQIQTGAIMAGAGVAGGIIGNLIINRNAPQERSAEITSEYESKKRDLDSEIADNQTALQNAIDDTARKIQEYNDLLRQHQEFVKTITEADCIDDFQEYIQYINGLTLVTNEMADTSGLVIKYDLSEQQQAYKQCADAAAARRRQTIDEYNALLNQHRAFVDSMTVSECREQLSAYIEYINGLSPATDDMLDVSGLLISYDLDEMQRTYNECVRGLSATSEQDEQATSDIPATPQQEPLDPNACPDENPRFRSAKGKRVGDFCSYGNVARGHIFKFADGTMRSGVDVGGTCSCSADECVAGYKLESGMCTECADGYHKDENGKCVQNDTTNADAQTLPICPYEEFQANWEITNPDTCVAFCKKRAQEQNCQYKGGVFSNNICRCSPRNVNDLPPLIYYQVCGNDQGKTDGTEICVDEFFKDVRVQPNQAIALAQEYARIKENDETIICNETPRSCRINIVTNGDCIQCTSRSKEKKYYEFRFRRVDATGDANIQQDTLTSLCKLYDTDGAVGNAGFIPGTPATPGSAFCRTADSALCQKINDSAMRFGYQAQMGLVEINDPRSVLQKHDDVCVLLRHVRSAEDLRTVDNLNIDPMYFKNNGIQLQLGPEIETRICTYVKNTIYPTELTDCRCNDNTTPIRDVNSKLTLAPNDDVITCYINGQAMDFVFDDLSEASGITRRGGEQAMDCIVTGGTYSGKHCLQLNEQQCLDLRAANLANCPECKAVKWNPTDEICELPSSESAANLQRGIEIAGQVGLIAGGAVIALATGGTGVAAVVLVAVETTGGAISVAALEAQHQAAYDFLVESNKCKDASCAEAMIKENLQRLANLLNNFNDAQVSAIDQELARLVTLLPEDSEIFNELDSLSLAENRLSFWNSDSWEPEDVWETVGNVLSISSVITALGSSVVRQLRVATNAIATRMSTHADDILTLTRAQAKRLDDLVLEEQRLLARQAQNPGAREAAEIRSNLTRVRQERQTLLNQLGNPSEEALTAAKAEAYRLDDLQQAEAELTRLQQERANLYTTNRNGQQILRNGRTRHDVTALDNQIAAQQQRIRELGGTVDGAPDDAVAAVGTSARTGGATDDAARSVDDATDAAHGADAASDATNSADDAARAADSAADDAADAATDAARASGATDDAARSADDATDAAHGADAASDATNSADDAARVADSAADDATDAATDAARASSATDDAARSATEQASDILNNAGFKAALDEFERTGNLTAVYPRETASDDAWDAINSTLESRGIRMRPGTSGGRTVMAFDNIPDHPATITRLRNRASSSFNTYFDNLKNTGQGASWPASRLTDDEWKIVNDSLYDDGIRLRRNGDRMIMEEIPEHPAAVARQQARAADSATDAAVRPSGNAYSNNILTKSERVTYRNTPAYVYQPTGLNRYKADDIVATINYEGTYYAASLNKMGRSDADYMVITMSKSDADKMRYVWNGNDLTYPIDNSRNMARLQQQIGKPITSIRGTPVVIETMSDFGTDSGRAIVMVKVGNKKLPFYISTGSAGKTDVPTGKWEFFGGIAENGWFRKGSRIEEIANHYYSAELKQIADALDNTIGDLRNTELVLRTIGRQNLRGMGKVATLENAPSISVRTVNQSFPKEIEAEGMGGPYEFYQYLNQVKMYLQGL